MQFCTGSRFQLTRLTRLSPTLQMHLRLPRRVVLMRDPVLYRGVFFMHCYGFEQQQRSKRANAQWRPAVCEYI